jgi:2-oxoisovalerate dehydrogenase E2 component (dihydrolipoyl transacylase)
MARRDFKLPDLGEGLTEGEILQWLVAVGDEVKLNQPIVEVETAKAAVEVPSPYAGVVTALHHQAGDTVDVGAPIISFETEPGAAGAAANPAESATRAVDAARRSTVAEEVPAALANNPPDDPAVEPGLIGGPAPGGRTSVLVGYGPRAVTARRRPRRGDPAVAPAPPPTPPARVSAAAVGDRARQEAGAVAVLAKPPVRKRARDLGVDLRAVTGTGPNGTVTRADVEAAARTAEPAPTAVPEPVPAEALPPPGRVPPTRGERRIPVKGVRKLTAQAMVTSAFTAPHVTEFLTVDVTPAMELRSRLAARPEFAAVKVSPLLLVAKALLLAVRRHPEINASWDETAQEIVVKEYVNLGIAAATPRGLLVPNVKDADLLALPELAAALQELAATARDGKTGPTDMAGGTITITNVGVFGVDNGTPILNAGEAAILCFGAVREMPWVYEGQITVRQVTQLSLSFDHRLVDGQLGSLFLADIGAMLADPERMLIWG